MVLLALISQKETYGYEIITALKKESTDLFGNTKEGTIYPILYRLEDEGLIVSKQISKGERSVPKKYYAITKKGVETLNELISFWESYTSSINHFLDQCQRKD